MQSISRRFGRGHGVIGRISARRHTYKVSTEKLTELNWVLILHERMYGRSGDGSRGD